MTRRGKRRSSVPGWLFLLAALALAAYLGSRRGRRLFAAISGALSDRALRALSDTFREESA
jgi:hypothetical protein